MRKLWIAADPRFAQDNPWIVPDPRFAQNILYIDGLKRYYTAIAVECPSNFGDLLTDFNCYVSIVRWLIRRITRV